MESRIALSGTAPTVVDVIVSSTEWTPAFFAYLESNNLGTGGYRIPVGSSTQTATLPWNNLDQFKVKFSDDVNVQAADLSLSGINVVSYAISEFFYDPQSCVATWTLAAPLAKDRLQIDLDADGIDPITDLEGNPLDGEWTNNSSTYPSGDNDPGGDFEFFLTVLPGDVNSSGQVTSLDYVLSRAQDGKSASSSGYSFKCDVNGSGNIDSTDWQFVLARIGNAPPTGSPAGAGNDAPTARRFAPVSVTNDAIDVAIALWNDFADAEDESSGLTYAIRSNTAPLLFDSVSINTSTGELVVNAASGAAGRAKITVSATDAGGISTAATISVDVNYDNQPPIILYPLAQSLPGHTWLISGQVADDDDVDGLIVVFYGVFATRAAVDSDGHFEFTVILEEDPIGWEYASTDDLQGLESNTVSMFIGVS